MDHDSSSQDLHDAHVSCYRKRWTLDPEESLFVQLKRFALDPDESLFIMEARGSLHASQIFLRDILHALERGLWFQDGLHEYILKFLSDRVSQLHADHEEWLRSRQGHGPNPRGRPSKKAQALHRAGRLEALSQDLQRFRRCDPAVHAEAIEYIRVWSEGRDRSQRGHKKRTSKGRKRENLRDSDRALAVWELLQSPNPPRSEAAAIRLVAEQLYNEEKAEMHESWTASRRATERARFIKNMVKSVEVAYYRRKRDLSGEDTDGHQGVIRGDLWLDD